MKLDIKDTLLKVVAWRLTSISTTLIFTSIVTGDIKQATTFTFMLHGILMAVHTAFEIGWNKMEKKNETR